MRAAVIGFTLLLLGCASVTPTSDAQFVEIEQQWVEALRTHDVAALDRLLDDNFIDSTFRGTIRTKHDVLTGPPAGGAYRSIRLDDVVVRRYGSRTAIVTGVNVVQGAAADDIVRVRFTDVFVAKDGQWRAVSAQETLQTDR